MRALVVALAAAALAGCGESAQTAGTAKKTDQKPWETSATGYGTDNWKAGDAKAWEEQLRARAQGQNEYSRSAPSAGKP